MTEAQTSDSLLHTEKLSDQVYTIIRDRILNNQLKPGTRINFNEILDELKISKTPLREALNKLQMEGFVDVKPRSGTYVSIPSKEDIIEMYDLRKAIEWQAVQLAIDHFPESELLALQKELIFTDKMIEMKNYNYFTQMDTTFHRSIMKYCKNTQIQNVMTTIDSHMKWFRITSATQLDRMLIANRRHRQILESMLEKNKHLTRDLMEIHIEEVKQDILEDYYKANAKNE